MKGKRLCPVSEPQERNRALRMTKEQYLLSLLMKGFGTSNESVYFLTGSKTMLNGREHCGYEVYMGFENKLNLWKRNLAQAIK